MTDQAYKLAEPLRIDDVLVTEIVITDRGPQFVTRDGEQLPLNVSALANLSWMSGTPGLTGTDAASIGKALTSLPLFWYASDGRPVARTVDGQDIPLGGKPDSETYAPAHLAALVQRLNASHSLRGSSSSDLGITIADLAKGVAGGIASAIASGIINAVFPGEPLQTYFDDLYTRLAELIHQEITQSVINNTNDDINGVIAYIKNTYTPRKLAKAPKDELYSDLKPWNDKMYELNYTLADDQYREPGFSVFLLGVSTHLAILQEMAIVDPLTNNPQESSYAETTENQANDYIAIGKKTWSTISGVRSNDVVENVQSRQFGPPQNTEIFERGSIVDNFTNTTYWTTTSFSAWLLWNGRKSYMAQEAAINELSTKLANPIGVDAVFNNWAKARAAIPTTSNN